MIRSLFPLAAMAICTASPALAHAFLERAVPPVGSELAASPPELVLTFTEGVEPLFSSIELRDAAGATVTISKPHTRPGNDRQLVIELPSLHEGKYTVIWHATSVDTHKTEGNFRFSVGPH